MDRYSVEFSLRSRSDLVADFARPARLWPGAIRLAHDLGPGKTVVTVLCDYGSRYQTKLFNPAFLAEKGLPTPDWLTPEGQREVPTAFEAV